MSTVHPESEYYLHTNGDVIYKPHGGVERDSPFVKKVWNANVIGESPKTFYLWLLELLDLGADIKRVKKLKEFNKLDSFISEEDNNHLNEEIYNRL